MSDSAAAIQIHLAPIRQRRARLLSALVSHGPVAVLLLGTGLSSLRATPSPDGAALALAIVATIAGAAQAYVLVQEVRESRHLESTAREYRRDVAAGLTDGEDASHMHGHETEARWHFPSLVLSLVYAAETWVHWHESGHVTRPFVIGAVAFAVFGLGGFSWVRRRKARRSALTVDRSGIRLTRPRRPVQWVAWDTVRAVSVSGSVLTIHASEGQGIALETAHFDNARAVISQTRSAFAHFGQTHLLSSAEPPHDAPPATAIVAPA